MIQHQAFTYPSCDQVHNIYAQLWTPQAQPRGVVQIVHGITEHMGRYHHVAQFLAQHGFLVCGEDHLGHGQTASDDTLGYFGAKNGWWLVVEDIHRLRQKMGEAHPGLPYVMLGHSMGSFLTRTYLIRHPGTLNGAVLSGTGQQPAPALALGQWTAALLCRAAGPQHVSPLIYHLTLGAYNRHFRNDPVSGSWLSRDPELVKADRSDPLGAFQPSVSMFRDMLAGLRYIAKPAHLAKMDRDTPIYFFSGDQDPVGEEGRGVRRAAELFLQAGCRDVTVRLYPGGRHEMLNEINRQQVMEDLLAWLEDKVL